MSDHASMKIDDGRLERWIHGLGEIGRDEHGSLFRPVYGTEWLAARDKIETWMGEVGLSTRVDEVGNLYGRLDGETSEPVILSGSHIDTVRNGGKYDGALGVLAALAAVAGIREQFGTPRVPIEVVALCEEEGSRFPKSYFGSRAICHEVDPTEPDDLVDGDGTSIGRAMSEVGLDAGKIADAARDDIAAFVELHIEQGRIMEDAGYPLGVVRSITGIWQLSVELTGRQDHAGTTPMDLRRDALAGSAEAMHRIEELARSMGRPAVATVGQVFLDPGSTNVVPGVVRFTLDLRHGELEPGLRLVEGVRSVLREVAEARGLDLHVDVVNEHHPVPLDEGVGEAIRRAAEIEAVAAHAMISGAGHDSQVFSCHVPTAMIFTPSRDGISHSPDEFTPIEEITPCVRVLGRTLWLLASGRDLTADAVTHDVGAFS